MNAFRIRHVLDIFSLKEEQTPIDAHLRSYFRRNTSIGSKDRKWIAETIYGMIRWQGLIDATLDKNAPFEQRIEHFLSLQNNDFATSDEVAPHNAVSFPKVLWQMLCAQYGEQKAREICLASNKQAPTTIRCNALKMARESLLKKLEMYHPKPTQCAPLGITFPKRINFFELDEFKAGYFEVQDEGSQCIAEHIEAKPGDHILDFCSGSGGKTLAFAPKLEGKGQIYLYDIRHSALREAKKRLKRAGIQNAQILDDKALKRKSLRGKMDWVLLDVPCSGTGTLRRNPDMKWKITPSDIEELCAKGRAIVQRALPFVKQGGYLVYATCSILAEENDKQLEYLLATYPLRLVAPPFRTLPEQDGPDGFYAAVLQVETV